MSKSVFNSATEITLPSGRGPLLVKGEGIEVEFRDGKIHVHSGEIVTTPTTSSLAATASSAALNIGDAVQAGANKGWIYCESPQCAPFLAAPENLGLLEWHDAMTYAAREEAELPTHDQLNAMYDLRNTGKMKDTFRLMCYVWYWSATETNDLCAWSKNFETGVSYSVVKSKRHIVRPVRPLSMD